LDSHVISAKNAVQEQHVKMKQRLSMHNTWGQMRQKIDQIHTVHICTPGKKGNPQEYQASWSFARRSVHDFLFLSVLEATVHQKLRIITLPSLIWKFNVYR
jgi:hypothetical protein